VLDVAAAGAAAGLGVHGVAASPLPGPSGNVEYFLWLRRRPQDGIADDAIPPEELESRVHDAVAAGPQGAAR
jgi:23S rRNA (cytidine1920-2'-O)/16S rRNA (cytidine1409-2'-O)-methyltransferase